MAWRMADAAFYIWLLLSFFVLTEDASYASFSETSPSTDGFCRYSLEKAGERASIRGTTTTTSIDRQRVTWPTNVLVTTKSKFKCSHVVTPYYNNSMLKLMPFDIELNPCPISALTFKKPIYIMGDFNCSILNNETRNLKALLDFCRSFNFSQLITSSTRTTDVSKSLLGIKLYKKLFCRSLLHTVFLQQIVRIHSFGGF